MGLLGSRISNCPKRPKTADFAPILHIFRFPAQVPLVSSRTSAKRPKKAPKRPISPRFCTFFASLPVAPGEQQNISKTAQKRPKTADFAPILHVFFFLPPWQVPPEPASELTDSGRVKTSFLVCKAPQKDTIFSAAGLDRARSRSGTDIQHANHKKEQRMAYFGASSSFSARPYYTPGQSHLPRVLGIFPLAWLGLGLARRSRGP